MRIKDVECVPVRMPLRTTFHGSNYQMTSRCTLITRIVSDEDVVSLTYSGDEDGEQAAIQQIILEELRPLVVGEDPFATERLWERMSSLTRDILRNRSLVLQAIASVDAAIHDLVGRALGVPLYRLWGGYRNRLPMLAIGGYYAQDPPEQSISREIEEMMRLGFAGVKFKIGKLSAAEDAHRTRLARKVAGPDFVIAVDANQAWTREEAIRYARLTEDLGLAWFEEPCHWDNDHLLQRDVRYIGGLPIVAGQSEISHAGCRQLFEAGAVDQCNFDSSWGGGPTEWRRVAGLAFCYGIRMGHHEEPQTASHLLAAIPHGTYLEGFLPDRDPIFWELFASRSDLKNGYYELSDRPGFGIELDPLILSKYRVA